MYQEDQIFGISTNPQKAQDNKPTYCDIFDDDKYVAQFLNMNDIAFDMDQYQDSEPIVEMIVQEEEQMAVEEPIIINQDLNKQVEEEKKKSSFHNFQKHLVTTIRSIVDMTKTVKNIETAQCEKKIWKVFINSRKINKTLVTMAMGDLTEEPNSKLNEYGFKEVMREFKAPIIRKSQQILYKQVIHQLSCANLQAELSKRRMKNKSEFIIYFKAFMEELVNGELQKRMAKCTKLLKDQQL